MSASVSSRSSLARFGSLARVMRPLASAVRTLSVAMRNRRQVTELLNADSAMLRDLGLTPMDITCALSEPLWRDPSARLLIWTIERRAAARAAVRDNLSGLAPVPGSIEAGERV